MALYRKATALLNVDKPSVCYDKDDSNPSSNPVFQAFEKQLNFILSTRKGPGRKHKNATDDVACKLYVCFSIMLFIFIFSRRVYLHVGSEVRDELRARTKVLA